MHRRLVPATAPTGQAPNRLRPHRVEHRTADSIAVLETRDLCVAHHAALTRYASKLRLAGQGVGELVLIDCETGRIVARRHLDS